MSLVKLAGSVSLVAALVALVCLAPGAPPRSSSAQPGGSPPAATPVALDSLVAPYPAGIALSALAVAALGSPPPNPATMRLDRYSLTVDDQLAGALPGPRLIVVENGELLVSDAAGSEARYLTGASLLVPEAETVTLTAGGPTPAVILQAALVPGANPVGTELTGPAPQSLLAGSERLPRGESTLALLRFTVAPGVDTGPRVFSGPVGFAVESGALTILDLGGAPASLAAGGTLLAPAFTQHVIRNDGEAAVSGVAIAVFPVTPALAGAPAVTATPATDSAATAIVGTLVARDATREADRQTESGTAATTVAGAQATAATVAIDSMRLTTDLATLTARSFSAEATANSLAPTVTAALSDLTVVAGDLATGQADAAADTVAAAGQVATLSAQATAVTSDLDRASAAVTGAEATNAAQAMVVQQVAATATAQTLQAAAIQATASVELTAAAGNLAGLAAAEATADNELSAAQATVASQSAELGTVAAATAPGIDANFRPVFIDQNVSGVVGGDPAARTLVVDAVRQQLAAELQNQCQASLVLTFGYAEPPNVNPGVELADAVNELIIAEIPELFANPDTLSLAQLEQPYGAVELRVYLASGCDLTTPITSITTITTPVSPTIVSLN